MIKKNLSPAELRKEIRSVQKYLNELLKRLEELSSPIKTRRMKQLPSQNNELFFCRMCDSYTDHLENICQDCGSGFVEN